MASPVLPSAKRIAAASPPLELLTDDLLAEILLRLPTLADLGRAASSCAAFRRIAAGRAFLRRLRSVHPAPLLGLLRYSIQPTELPHSSAPYARAFAGVGDPLFSFLPSLGIIWFPADARDGRVLLELFDMSRHFVFAVCDPLSRRYVLLPQIPGDPASQRRCCIKPFLVPASGEEAETSFRVVCAVKDAAEQLVAFVFSSATGQWSSLAMGGVQPSRKLTMPRGYAYSCFYWKVDGSDNLIVFDTRSMEFSSLHIPFSQDQQHQDIVIMEAGGGRLGMFTIDNSIISAVSHLVYAIQEINEDSSSTWRIERRVRLPSQFFFRFEDATDRYLLLRGTSWNLQLGSTMDDVETGYFSFEFESMQIEKMYAIRSRHELSYRYAKLYTGFPPSLCLPSI